MLGVLGALAQFERTLLATTSAQGEQSRCLKGVTDVTYVLLTGTKKEHCDIAWKAWYTAIDFVANQSLG
jgi:hypothetical protein